MALPTSRKISKFFGNLQHDLLDCLSIQEGSMGYYSPRIQPSALIPEGGFVLHDWNNSNVYCHSFKYRSGKHGFVEWVLSKAEAEPGPS